MPPDTFIAWNFAEDEDDEKFDLVQQEIAEADGFIPRSQRPEELTVDVPAELHATGSIGSRSKCRRWLAELEALAPTSPG